MLRIAIDSAGDLPPGWADEYQIDTIPINIHFGEQMYLQGVNLSNADFYQKADRGGAFPKTSQPSPQQFIDFYRRIADPGDVVLSIHVTAKLSGTFASAEMAAQELGDEIRVIAFDSACGSAGQGYLARTARCMQREGASIEQILARLNEYRSNVQILLTLNTLEYARRSGRVKALQAALASLLNVKPVVILKAGVLELGDRVRTRGKALEFVANEMARRLDGQPAYVAVVHAQDPDAARQLSELVRSRLNCRDFIVTELSIGIAANLGPGTVGIVAIPVGGEKQE
jgi:DegV family protein with EDD domain